MISPREVHTKSSSLVNDNDGEENYNLILSERAETVRRKIETFGVKNEQIEVYYYVTKPLKDNNNKNKRFNRRAKFKF